LALFVDLRTIGSNGGLYADTNLPVTERGTRLLLDVLGQLHDQLVDYALELADGRDMTAALTLLDNMADAITEVEVVGEREQSKLRCKKPGPAHEPESALGSTRVGRVARQRSGPTQRRRAATRPRR
jgi:hypothetical protein